MGRFFLHKIFTPVAISYLSLVLLAVGSLILVGTQNVQAQSELAARFIPMADTIVVNARIYSMDEVSTGSSPGTVASAMAIKDGKVLGLGSNEEIRMLADLNTEVLDAGGRTVVPGIIDTHSHLDTYGVSTWSREVLKGGNDYEWRIEAPPFDFRWGVNWEEGWEHMVMRGREVLREAVANTEPGKWIVMVMQTPAPNCQAGYLEARYTKQNMQLDEIAPNHRVHVICVQRPILNSMAEAFYRSEWGEPMEPGLMDAFNDNTGRASNTLSRVLRTDYLSDTNELAEILERQNKLWAATGITTWASTLRGRRTIELFRLLDHRGTIGTRVAFSPSLGTLSQTTFERMDPGFTGYGTDYVWFTGLSLRGVDGAYPSFSTSLEPPQIPQEIKNREWVKPTNEWVEAILATGHRYTSTHTAGDNVLESGLDAIERESAKLGLSLEDIRAQRHGFDHCAMNPRPDQIPRIAELGVIMSCKPGYLETMVIGVAMDYGPAYTKWVVPVGGLIKGGARVVLEIDDRNHPEYGTFYWLDLLVNRVSDDGQVYNPEERIDRVLAMKMATIWAAEYVLKEDVLGSLEPGKWADFLILDKPYFDRNELPDRKIKTVRPLLTRVGNKTIYLNQSLADEWGIDAVSGAGTEQKLETLRQRISGWEAEVY
jgi:predicted amidohydrolase YtcJ